MPAESIDSTPPEPPTEPPRFTVALAVAALSDDQAREIWEGSEYVVQWGTQEGQEILWLQRDGNLPLVSWSTAEAQRTLAFVLSLDYSATCDFAWPFIPPITGDDLIAFVLGCRGGLRSLACQDIP